ncbi:MAG: hypothetical protein L0H84_11915, partial [Pseudonocardia sp.]|nr:hypothetical protein [Pseudonocardia sp.]
ESTAVMRALRTVTGLLAGGLVALVVALGIAWVVAARVNVPGPGTGRIVLHLVAAAAAVAAQRYADRHPDVGGVAAALAVLVVAATLLAVAWIT